jgi:hypothetical protein
VGTAGGILDAENVYFETHGTEGSGGRGSGKTGAHDDDVNLALVGRVHQFLVGFIIGPFFRKGTFGYFGIEIHVIYIVFRIKIGCRFCR